jgi:hypothetical protein
MMTIEENHVNVVRWDKHLNKKFTKITWLFFLNKQEVYQLIFRFRLKCRTIRHISSKYQVNDVRKNTHLNEK